MTDSKETSQELVDFLSDDPDEAIGYATGMNADGTVNVRDDKGNSINAIAATPCVSAPTSVERVNGTWYAFQSPNQVISERTVINRRLRPIQKLPSPAFGLLASTNNYIDGNNEGVVTAALIAQLLNDTTKWTPPETPPTKTKRHIATLIGPTYTPLQPIREGLAAYGYVCEDITVSQLKNIDLIKKYDVLIGRIVTTVNEGQSSVIDDKALNGIKSMLAQKKLVVLGGCGCPYGSHPLNHLLLKLGFDWRVQETRSLPEEQKPTVSYPWVVQKKGKIRKTISYRPRITDVTVFSNVKDEEALVLSRNNEVVMAYSPYPKCLKWKNNAELGAN